MAHNHESAQAGARIVVIDLVVAMLVFMIGKEYTAWIANAESVHRELMQAAGFLAAKK